MKKVILRKFSQESFSPYGVGFSVFEPGKQLGNDKDVLFYPDNVQIPINVNTVAVSHGFCYERPQIIRSMEVHRETAEGIISIDGEAAFFVCLSKPDGSPDIESLVAFQVPEGMFLVLNTGTWHLAPFPIGCKKLTTLCFLPERTYENDCDIYAIPEGNEIQIIFEHENA